VLATVTIKRATILLVLALGGSCVASTRLPSGDEIRKIPTTTAEMKREVDLQLKRFHHRPGLANFPVREPSPLPISPEDTLQIITLARAGTTCARRGCLYLNLIPSQQEYNRGPKNRSDCCKRSRKTSKQKRTHRRPDGAEDQRRLLKARYAGASRGELEVTARKKRIGGPPMTRKRI